MNYERVIEAARKQFAEEVDCDHYHWGGNVKCMNHSICRCETGAKAAIVAALRAIAAECVSRRQPQSYYFNGWADALEQVKL